MESAENGITLQGLDLEYLMELLKLEFCEGLFDDVVQPLGEFVADSNAKYFVNRKTT